MVRIGFIHYKIKDEFLKKIYINIHIFPSIYMSLNCFAPFIELLDLNTIFAATQFFW